MFSVSIQFSDKHFECWVDTTDKSHTDYLITEILGALHCPPNTDFWELDWGWSTGFHFSKLNKIAAGTLWALIPIYMHNTKNALT